MNKNFSVITFLAVAGLSYFQENLYGGSVFYDPDKINDGYTFESRTLNDAYKEAFKEVFAQIKLDIISENAAISNIANKKFSFNFLDELIVSNLKNIGNPSFRQIFRNILSYKLLEKVDFIFDDIISIKNKNIKNAAVDIFKKNISELFRPTDWVTNETFGEHFRDIVIKYFDGLFWDDFWYVGERFLEQIKVILKPCNSTFKIRYVDFYDKIASDFFSLLDGKNKNAAISVAQQIVEKLKRPISNLFGEVAQHYEEAVQGKCAFLYKYVPYYRGYDYKKDVDTMTSNINEMSVEIAEYDHAVDVLRAKVQGNHSDIHDQFGQMRYSADAGDLRRLVQSKSSHIDFLRRTRDILLKNIDFLQDHI